MVKVLFIAFFLLFIGNVQGQKETSYVFRGTVVEEDSEIPVSYASVHIKNRTIGTISDSLGRFTLEISNVYFNDTLVVSAVGYKKFKELINNFNPKQELTIELTDSIYILDEVLALCYDNIEAHLWSTSNQKKTMMMLSYATRKIENVANYVNILKEHHGVPKMKSDMYTWKNERIKKFEENKVTFTLATYSCSYCPLKNEYMVVISVKDKHDNNLLDNEQNKEFLRNYFQKLLDMSFDQGVDFSQIEIRNDLAFLKGEEITYTGKCISYYKKGQKGKTGEYLDGKATGIWIWWFENGQKGKEVNYIEGEMTGTCQWWFPNGQLKRVSEFLNGKKVGMSAMYYENGTKKFEGEYNDDEMHGTCTWWYDNGQKQKESVYENGIFKTKTEWDTKGNVIERVILD
ncbi:MAG: carboxypeptidase-like regulatory domain-containing protein [Bacteroidetes bacterium]|nr:carboxypeptidase-like regulatory domain-containing protein [Bacteroidota bacterium]